MEKEEKELLELCSQPVPDLDAIKQYLSSGIDLNREIDDENNLLTELYRAYPFYTEQASFAPLITRLFIDAGFDVTRHGFNCLYALRFSIYNQYAGETAKVILEHGAKMTDQQWEELLDSVGTEESYNSVEGDHALANNAYAFYEMLDHARRRLPFADIKSWEDGVGLLIQGIEISSDTTPLLMQTGEKHFSLDGELLLKCGEQTVILQDRPNIFIQSTKQADRHTCSEDASGALRGIAGKTINRIYFENRYVKKKKTKYRQPQIYLELSDGITLHAYTNFGEAPKRDCKILLEIIENKTES